MKDATFDTLEWTHNNIPHSPYKFCYNCIVHWTKVVANKHSCPPSSVKSPLCKISFATIVLYIGPKWLLTSILAHLPLLRVLYARVASSRNTV
ncbi:hypothetical protein LOK49_LG06G00908 [Camellia lanceoleosa]|uniref:Uncharacterized protein n=1 Tax=Camellia lanceoleosa TaxID=1840588 RepID=A0ACC0HAI7_9ERIC|nr:hypothetical protein LOK49_LG06G00908 [Camellia lanceoleosa]